jgi:hypothetical protein
LTHFLLLKGGPYASLFSPLPTIKGEEPRVIGNQGLKKTTENREVASAATAASCGAPIVNPQLFQWCQAKTKFGNLNKCTNEAWAEYADVVQHLGSSLSYLLGMNLTYPQKTRPFKTSETLINDASQKGFRDEKVEIYGRADRRGVEGSG